MDKNDQMIMAVPRQSLFGCFHQYTFNGFVRDELFTKQMAMVDYYNGNQSAIAKLFHRRGPLESAPAMKQIIPYVIVGDILKKKILCYVRPVDGNEDRLHGKASIGFGGHIELSDLEVQDKAARLFDIIICCAHREVQEELKIDTSSLKFTPIGYINDDSTDVGKVHFGVVMYCDTSHMQLDITNVSADEVGELQWSSIRNLLEARADGRWVFEKWSDLILPVFESISFYPLGGPDDCDFREREQVEGWST